MFPTVYTNISTKVSSFCTEKINFKINKVPSHENDIFMANFSQSRHMDYSTYGKTRKKDHLLNTLSEL